VDEVIAVPVPTQCDCGGELEVERMESQYQQEIQQNLLASFRHSDLPLPQVPEASDADHYPLGLGTA